MLEGMGNKVYFHAFQPSNMAAVKTLYSLVRLEQCIYGFIQNAVKLLNSFVALFYLFGRRAFFRILKYLSSF